MLLQSFDSNKVLLPRLLQTTKQKFPLVANGNVNE